MNEMRSQPDFDDPDWDPEDFDAEEDDWDDEWDRHDNPAKADPDAGDLFDEGGAGHMKFRNFYEACPACGKPVTDEMDCCPYCGDVIFRSLRHGTFAPKKGPWTRIFAAIVIIVATLGAIAFVWSQLR